MKITMKITKLRGLISDIEAFALRVKDEARKSPGIKAEMKNFFDSESTGYRCSVYVGEDGQYVSFSIDGGDNLSFNVYTHFADVHCGMQSLLVFAEHRNEIIAAWEHVMKQASIKKKTMRSIPRVELARI